MSYHFYDMGFKDGYKKALQQLDEQRGGMNVLPGDVQTGPGGGMQPVSKIAGNFPSRGTPTTRTAGPRSVGGGRGGAGGGMRRPGGAFNFTKATAAPQQPQIPDPPVLPGDPQYLIPDGVPVQGPNGEWYYPGYIETDDYSIPGYFDQDGRFFDEQEFEDMGGSNPITPDMWEYWQVDPGSVSWDGAPPVLPSGVVLVWDGNGNLRPYNPNTGRYEPNNITYRPLDGRFYEIPSTSPGSFPWYL